jgi:hypothetical protein
MAAVVRATTMHRYPLCLPDEAIPDRDAATPLPQRHAVLERPNDARKVAVLDDRVLGGKIFPVALQLGIDVLGLDGDDAAVVTSGGRPTAIPHDLESWRPR